MSQCGLKLKLFWTWVLDRSGRANFFNNADFSLWGNSVQPFEHIKKILVLFFSIFGPLICKHLSNTILHTLVDIYVIARYNVGSGC